PPHTARVHRNTPSLPLLLAMSFLSPGPATPSPQSEPPDGLQVAPTPMKNVIGNVRSSSRGMNSSVSTFFSWLPLLTTSTSAKPSSGEFSLGPTFTLMRYVHSAWRSSWLVCQLTK